MKEQLAAMTIIELVRTAHSYATSIQQVETYSAIVTELAARLEALNLAYIGAMNNLRSATSTIDQLAAENSALKTPAHWLAAADIGDQAAKNAALTGANDDEQLLAGMVAIMESITTTATDAFLREQMVKGVEMFAAHKREWADHWDKHGVRDGSAPRCVMVAREASEFAAQLRAGEAV